MLDLAAGLYVFIVVIVILWIAITKTDRYFWKGMVYGVIIIVVYGLFFLSLDILITGSAF